MPQLLQIDRDRARRAIPSIPDLWPKISRAMRDAREADAVRAAFAVAELSRALGAWQGIFGTRDARDARKRLRAAETERDNLRAQLLIASERAEEARDKMIAALTVPKS